MSEYNRYITSAESLVTTYEEKRAGFLNMNCTPFVRQV